MKPVKLLQGNNHLNARELIKNHNPQVFKGAFSPPKAAENTLARMVRKIGAETVEAMSGFYEDEGLLSYANPGSDAKTRNTLNGPCKFGKFAAQALALSQQEGLAYFYCQLLDVRANCPALLPMVKPFAHLIDLKGNGAWNFWIGSGKHRINTHYDRVENFYFVLGGRKIFHLFPPETLPLLYPGPIEGGPAGVPESVVDANHPDLKKYPRFGEALDRGFIAELAPGDMLYLPANWWHNVQSQGLNISLNLWWSDIEKADQLSAELAFLHALKSIKPLPRHWRDYWNANFDSFVFSKNGDPLAHLETGKRGIGGNPTPSTRREITKRIRDLEGEIFRLNLDLDFSNPDLKLACSEDMKIKFGGDEEIEIYVGNSKVLTESIKVFDLLKEFSKPRNPLEIYAKVLKETCSEAEFAKHLVKLVRSGVLVKV